MEQSGSKGESSVPKFGSFKLPPGASDKAAPSSDRDRSTRERTREREHRREPESRSSRPRSRDDRSNSPRRSHRSHNEKYSEHRHSSSRHRRHKQPDSSRQSREETRRREHRTPRESYPPSEYSKNKRSASPERSTHKPGALRAPSAYGSSGSLDRSAHATTRFELASKDGITRPGHASQGDSSIDDLFVIDLVGDPDIHKYGRKKRWDVPDYSLFGAGYVLGLGKTHRIDRRESRGDYVVLRPTMAADSVFKGPERDALSATRDTRETGNIQRKDRNESLVPSIVETMRNSLFSNQNHQSSQLLNRAQPSHLDATADFVSFDTDDIDPSADTDQSFEYAIDHEAEERVRDAALSKAAEENPDDVSAWLRLIDHQDVLIPGSHDESRNLTRAEQHSLADKKLFIYDKALRKVGKGSQKDRLLLGRLQVGAQIWDRRKVLDQWKTTLRENPEFIGLWVKYLDFFQADSPNFILHQCIAAHMESLRIISSARSRDTGNSLAQVYVFLRLTILYRDAGYNELAVGLWQALFEFSYFKPESVESFDDALGLFHEFWESETTRIGEIGANGWGRTANSDVDPVSIEYYSHINDSSLLESWIEAERERMDKLQMPSRSLDGTTPPFDDPYNIVLYSDLRDVLRLFEDCKLDSLIDAFLCFCQLPILTSSSNIQTARLWSGDSFVRNELVEDPHLNLGSWISPSPDTLEAGEAPRPTLPFMFPLQKFLHTTDTLFAHPEFWFSSFQSKRDSQPEWAQRTLQLLISRHSSIAELTEYCLALEFMYAPKSAKKFAKTALRERPTSLRLWNALAMMEIRSNSREKALTIWSNALSNSFSWPSAEALERSLIWQSWAWQYVEQGEKSAASYILHNVGNEKIDLSGIPQQGDVHSSFSATATLRTQKLLRELQGQALASKNSQAYVAYTDCLGLVYYLTDWPFKSAIDVFAEAVSQVEQLPSEFQDLKAFTTELLHQARARLVWDRIKNGPKIDSEKPTEYRELLEESITLFRHNTMFSTICMWNESRVLRIDRLRVDKLLQQDSEQQYKLTDVLSLNEPISNTLLPIWLEISSGRGEPWRIRSLFETALAGVYSRARANLTIWKLYMIYELDHVKDMSAAKIVFQRAIQACPWSKELIMFGFEKLRGQSGLSVDELRQLLLVLGDRQLRIRLDIRNELIRQAADEAQAQADQQMTDALQ